jgi:hypothetical protein
VFVLHVFIYALVKTAFSSFKSFSALAKLLQDLVFSEDLVAISAEIYSSGGLCLWQGNQFRVPLNPISKLKEKAVISHGLWKQCHSFNMRSIKRWIAWALQSAD